MNFVWRSQKGDFWSWVCASPNSSLEMLPLPSLSKSLNASSTALGTAAIYSPSTRGTLARCAAHKCYMRGFLVSLWAKNLTAFCGFLFTSLRIITNPLIDKKCQKHTTKWRQNDVKLCQFFLKAFGQINNRTRRKLSQASASTKPWAMRKSHRRDQGLVRSRRVAEKVPKGRVGPEGSEWVTQEPYTTRYTF